MDPAELAARLTLLTLLFTHIGSWHVRPLVLLLAGYGLLAPGALRSSLLWLALAALSGWRVLEDWPLADNHAYLLAYWCLALSIAFATSQPARMLPHQARWLIGLVFLLAVLQKGSTANFVDGTFFSTLYLLDPRFEDLTVLLTSLSYADLDAARQMMEADFRVLTRTSLPFLIPSSLRAVSWFSTWWSLLEQAAAAIAFLAPVGSWLHGKRDFFLVLFCLTAYAVAPVPGFGWLLIAMAISQCAAGRWRTLYLFSFGMLALYYYVPWASMLVNQFDDSGNAYVSLPWHWHLTMGSFAFGAVFLATDPVSAASTNTGRWIYGLLIGICYLQGLAELALTLGLLLGKNVIEMGLRALVAALARPAEALGRAPVGLHFRHVAFLLAVPRTAHRRPLQAGSAFRAVKPFGLLHTFSLALWRAPNVSSAELP